MHAVEADGLYKRFGETVAVDGVSFKVRKGEVFGFLGPNGAGKTTTIRMLTGLIKPDRGTARIMGYDVQGEPLKAKSLIGVVPEEANPYPDLSAWDNLVLAGMLYGLPRRKVEERATRLLKLLEIYGARNRKAKALSKGMRQRLLIAMALISEPQVLFLDEPTSGLDVFSARKIRGLIRSLSEAGVTVFLTTHNVEEAGAICDRVAIINKGRIVALGDPVELKIKAGDYIYVTVTLSRSPEEYIRLLKPYEYRVEGKRIHVVCTDVGDVLERILEYARANQARIVSVQTSQPSFEEIFIRLVGGRP